MEEPSTETAHRATPVDMIRSMIIEGEIEPGERLKVTELARRFSTSTNPIREALQLLQGEGFVEIDVNRGARSRRIGASFIRDTYEIVAEMESYLVRAFCRNCTRAQLDDLIAIQDQIEDENFASLDRFGELDLAFHSLMYCGHYNTSAIRLWEDRRKLIKVVSRSQDISLIRQKDIVSEHRAIIDAIEKQDTRAASDIIRKHSRGAGERILERYR